MVCMKIKVISLCRLMVILILSYALSKLALAGKWDIEPSIYVAGSHNDNIFLDAPGSERSDKVLQVNPAILLQGQGQRATLSLYYEVQNVFYSTNSEFNDTFHNLNAAANAELLADLFYIDATAGRAQQIISRDAAIPVDNVTISANRTDVDLASVSPYFKSNIGKNLQTEVRYSGSWLSYENDFLSDQQNKIITAELNNALSMNRTQWGLYYTNRKFEPDIGNESSFERGYIDIDYSLSGQLAFLGSLGRENNEYGQGLFTRVEKGTTWDVGFRWNPARQNTILLRLGERVFGKTKKLEINYVSRRWTIGAGYDEEFRNNLGVLVRNQDSGGVGDPIVGPGDPTPTTETFLSKSFDVHAVREFSRTRLNFSAYSRKREFQISGDTEDISGGEAGFDWQFQRRTSLELSLRIQNQKLRGGQNNDDLLVGNVALIRNISRKTTGSLAFRHYRRDSSDPTRSIYKQNQITLDLKVIF